MHIDLSNVFVDACIISSFLQTEWEPDFADTIYDPQMMEFELVSFKHGRTKDSLQCVKNHAYFIPDLGYLMRLAYRRTYPNVVLKDNSSAAMEEQRLKGEIIAWWKREKTKYLNSWVIDTIQKLVLFYIAKEIYRVPPPFFLLHNN